MKFYKGNITPEKDVVFVFGSNPEGRHGAGSAKFAVLNFGAVYGQGEGLQGNAYALPTTELRLSKQRYIHGRRITMDRKDIIGNIRKMLDCARSNPEKKFMVAYRNLPDEETLCGYTGREMMEMFREASGGEYPDNIYFSEEWAGSGIM